MVDRKRKQLPKMMGFNNPTPVEERIFASFDELRRKHPEVVKVVEEIAEELEEEA